MKAWSLLAVMAMLLAANVSKADSREYLVRFTSNESGLRDNFLKRNGGKIDLVSEEGFLYKWTTDKSVDRSALRDREADVVYLRPNRTYSIFESPSLTENRAAIIKLIQEGKVNPDSWFSGESTKPEIKDPPDVITAGEDPLLKDAWGMFKVAADLGWRDLNRGKGIVVAVTDSGMDYNHEDLIANVWRNPNEIPNNQIDDDSNGYVDDVIGWDFVTNDNKPYDQTKGLLSIVLGGGNPGHGTHCSGVVGASYNNSLGTSGVAPDAKIMPLRFIDSSGKGSDEAAIKAIDYAVKNGANIISASWGGEAGDDDDKPLKEAIERAGKKGVIFVAAAGNGRLDASALAEAGYDNDNDKKPILPASFGLDNIIAVAAVDSKDQLASFSNWGKKTVQLAAPGVKILSTVPGNKYQDSIIDLGPIKATWDGTSMATPFVAGALAVVWSQNPGQSWDQVKDSLLSNTKKIDGLSDKVATGGRLDLRGLTTEGGQTR